MNDLEALQGPHGNSRVIAAGEPLQSAHAALILVHGRGATAESILTLVPELRLAEDARFAFLAPQAVGSTWYPFSFLEPLEQNEPYLSSALALLTSLVNRVEAAGVPAERTYLLGFSQGACLSLEFAARNARRYGGIFGLSGGLIGPDDTPRDYPGSFAGTPIFLGCSDVDFHIPKERVLASGEVLKRMGADVEARLYPGMGHTINADEIEAVRDVLARG
jgi:phospholipase/carboxylesterase